MNKIYYTLIFIFAVYLIVTLGLYIFQRKLLYYPNFNSYLKGDGLIHSFKNIYIKTKDSINLKGWFHLKDPKKKNYSFFSWQCRHIR